MKKPDSKKYSGFIDYLDNFFIRGWALSKLGNKIQQVNVSLYIDDELVETQKSVNYRIDLDNDGWLNGRLGFEFKNPLNSKIDFKKRCRIKITDKNDNAVFEIKLYVPKRIVVQKKKTVPASSFYPVFIVGAPRSGTSAIHQVLAKCTSWPSFNEGNLLPAVIPIDKAVREFRQSSIITNTMCMYLAPEIAWQRSYVALFRELSKQLYPNSRWIDKTPGADMIRVIPFIKQCWPDSKFIFMKRRGIENISSGLNKFSALSFEDLCNGWAACFEQWEIVKSEIKGRFIEIDQLDMLISPTNIGVQVSDFVGLSNEKRELFVHLIQTYFPERTSELSKDNFISLNETNWSEAQKEFFISRCSNVMNSYGYSFGNEYYFR